MIWQVFFLIDHKILGCPFFKLDHILFLAPKDNYGELYFTEGSGKKSYLITEAKYKYFLWKKIINRVHRILLICL
jgi:hypothetical protein